MKWKIGNVEIDNQVVLAPMAGVTDKTFRTIIKEMGAGLLVTEMISSEAIVRKNKKTLDMLDISSDEKPISVQLFGGDQNTMALAAKYVYENIDNVSIIDINMGCPVPKVALSSNAGSSLLKDPNRVYEIVKAVVDSVPIPVTVKIRSGWDNDSINAKEIAKLIEKAGASAIAIHPRTRKQGNSGQANWDIIKEVKKCVNIPVIGNGDIKSYLDAEKMLEETKCDAVMIGRATLGNPWIIKDCVDYLEKGIIPKEVTLEQKINMIKKHLDLLIQNKPLKCAMLEIRSHASWYIKGLYNAKELKEQIFKTKTKEEFEQLLDLYLTEKNNL